VPVVASTASRLVAIYDALYGFWGPQHWWPADSAFEVLVGAILTQNTNWQNVKKAIDRLRDGGLLSLDALHSLPESQLAAYIRPSGYYNLKARRLKNLLQMIADNYGGDLELLLQEETAVARRQLLSVKGVGPETADSILLYGGGHPLFVVDAYTYRIFSRHQFLPEECDYQTMQDLFMDNLPPDAALFNEYHALIVMTAKRFCKKKEGLCEQCPLNGM
jgi:endonuclease-3 related protein